MIFFWLASQRHQCSPLPIGDIFENRKLVPSEHSAGYDIIATKAKTAQCAVCGRKYHYDFGDQENVGFISYGEIAKKRITA